MTECATCRGTRVVRRGRVSRELRWVDGLGMMLSADFTDVPCPDCGRVCMLCTEPIVDGPPSEWKGRMHRACALRGTIGGIGHLIAHDYWCLDRHDPDAGLTYRQSAQLVDEFVAVVGIDEATRRL